MAHSSFASRYNLEVIDTFYRQWQGDPESVEPMWRAFFEGFSLAASSPTPAATGDSRHTGVVQLIFAYRDIGHLQAHLDPLADPPAPHPLLDLQHFGLKESDLDQTFDCSAFFGLKEATLRELVAALQETYCRTIGVEFRHIQDSKVRNWLKERMEVGRNRPKFATRQKLRILMTLHFAELFEKFLHTRFVGQKRFSLEGAETLIPILDCLVEKAPSLGIREFVIGMAHRGRLNVLANILRKPYGDIFAEFEDNFVPDSMDGDGDVKYHLGFSSDYATTGGQSVHLSLTPNPSHLEAVNPVVEGRVRAKQRRHGDAGRKLGVPLLIHGDAAFAGQGIVAETLNLSGLDGYSTGGTIHIVVNNQIGFTTSPADARSTTYCTDVAKMIQAPILHVNAEDPAACVYAAELALEFRQTFHCDVVVDMYCYRKYGHNEGDEPTFTQPLMYRRIDKRPTVSAIYTAKLIEEKVLQPEEADAIDRDFQDRLRDAHRDIRETPPKTRGMRGYGGDWRGLQMKYSSKPADTRVDRRTLANLVHGLTETPVQFAVNPKIGELLKKRRSDFAEDRPIDWAFAESLAFGTLVREGHPVRLSGQDSRRGTFSQRHAVLVDHNTGQRFVPLNAVPGGEGLFEVYDSLLSESAVLGFEFGYALDSPNALVMWEAQFGDFVNSAQVIIDQFIVCSESKWQRSSGVVLLLPHGYEGQGPEHSSARLERFLQACADDNIQVCNLTTPAQYFHALRRQLKRDFRKPLVIMTPKSLLRHKKAVSPIAELTDAGFRELIDDNTVKPERVKRLVFCSGKVYYDLLERRSDEIALIRLEQFYPFPEEQLKKTLARYPLAKEIFWVQEESQNMGGWSFVEPRFSSAGVDLVYVGRDASASPAVGSLKVHQREQAEILEAACGNLPEAKPAPRNGTATVVGKQKV